MADIHDIDAKQAGKRMLLCEQLPELRNGNQGAGTIQGELPGESRDVFDIVAEIDSAWPSRTIDILEYSNQADDIRVVNTIVQGLGFAAIGDQPCFAELGQML